MSVGWMRVGQKYIRNDSKIRNRRREGKLVELPEKKDQMKKRKKGKPD